MHNFLSLMGFGRVPCLTLPGNTQHNHMVLLPLVCTEKVHEIYLHVYGFLRCVFTAETVPVKAPDKVPLLAIAWDRKVQVAKLVKSELKIYGKWTIESSAIGVAWLDDEV